MRLTLVVATSILLKLSDRRMKAAGEGKVIANWRCDLASAQADAGACEVADGSNIAFG